MTLIKLLNLEGVSEEEVALYETRDAARAIVLDEEGLIALLNVTKDGYYKLPGGGIDEDESKIEALKRECLEEIGCQIEVLDELGEVVEYRKQRGLKQTSYCFVARVVGEKGEPQLEEKEAADGFVTEWVSLDEAIRKVDASLRDSVYAARYMVERDLAFLNAAKRVIGI